MLVIQRNGRTTVITGWRAWLLTAALFAGLTLLMAVLPAGSRLRGDAMNEGKFVFAQKGSTSASPRWKQDFAISRGRSQPTR